MKKFLIIFLVLMLLGGGGAGAWFYLNGQDAAASEEAEAESQEPPAPPVYVEFNPIQLPLLGEDGIEQTITIVVALEVPDDSAGDTVIAMSPRLNDAYMTRLYGGLHSHDLLLENGIIDVGRLKGRIVEASASVLGEGVVLDALVQMVAQRRE